MKEEAEKVARVLSDYVNSMDNKVSDVVEVLSVEHRTLQQGITKFCVAWLEDCARKQTVGQYDLRNEASCKLGKAFVERIKPSERAMPFI